MIRDLLPVIVAFFMAGTIASRAILPPANAPLPNYDRRTEQPNRKPAVSEQRHREALRRLEARVPGLKVQRDHITGTPRWITSDSGFLTGPNGRGRAVPEAALRGLENDRHGPIKAFLNEHAPLFGHDASALNGARISREFVTPHNGMRTVIWEQRVDGIPVFEALLTGHITKNQELVSLASHFIPDAGEAANRGMAGRGPNRAQPVLTAEEAITRAAAEIGVAVGIEEITEAGGAASQKEADPGGAASQKGADADGAASLPRYRAPGLNGTTEASPVWLPLDGTRLRLCWQIILTSRARGEMFRVLIDGETGAPLLRHGLTSYISEATYRVYTSDSPSPFSPGHSIPSTNQPPIVPRALITTAALNTNASPAGWINDGVNETRGNNVDAHLDRDNNDAPDVPRPQGSPNRVFDFPVNLAQSPLSYSNAAVVQLFYWNNWVHDKLYELGFTEAAGNFQLNNFGRGGMGNDAVAADAQDGGGFNNANMSTPPDGSPARMQMYLFDGPDPDRDGDFDAEVVIHEYVHGLSNRRVGGGVGISALQSAGMGEGWSDFYALALLSESGDNLDGNYAAGGYLTFQLSGLLENYYFGIRRYPYSTDITKNPLTFRDIDPTQAAPHTGVPQSPVFGDGAADEVHNQGEVWCVTLWEARANLIRKFGFETGNRLMLQLVTDGMALSPANPNFLEARDAIIEADRVSTGGANFYELWGAFANRGMGANATSPGSGTTVGLRESFDVPDDLLVLPLSGVLVSGPVGGPFVPASATFTLTNVSTNQVVWSVSSAALWLTISNSGGVLPPGSPAVAMSIQVNSAAADLAADVYAESLVFTNHVSGRTQSREILLAVGQPDHFTEHFAGDNDLDFVTLTFTPDGSRSFYALCTERASSLPVDPRDAKELDLADDDFAAVALPPSRNVTFYGKSTNVFFIGSNGYITFDEGDASLSDSLDIHFALPRIAALMTDLNPAAAGSVSWQPLADRVAVTWLNVPIYGTTNMNSCQIELFYDGRIRITYLRMDATAGLTGLSRGMGRPRAFIESDLSGYAGCAARLFVSVPQSLTEGNGTSGAISRPHPAPLPQGEGTAEGSNLSGSQGTVFLPVPALSNVVVDLRSSHPGQLTVPATITILTGQTDASFQLTAVDDSLLDGSQTITITASRAGYASGSATVTVHDNESTALALNTPTEFLEGSGEVECAITSGAVVNAPTTVALTGSPADSVIIPPSVVIPAGTNRATFAVAIADNIRIDGTRGGVIRATVVNWIGATNSFEILDDETTSLAIALPGQIIESAGTLSQRGLVSLPGTLTSNLVVSLSSSQPGVLSVPASIVIPAGALSNRFGIGVTDDAAVNGQRLVTITAQASGWDSGAAITRLIDDEAPPEAIQPFPVHLSSNNPVTVDLSWSTGEGELVVNGGFETGDFTGWTRKDIGSGSFIINDGMITPQSGDAPVEPFAGDFSAMADQTGPGRHTVYQDIALPGVPATLRWAHRIRNHATEFATNQFFRVEIRDTNDTVLEIAFTTQPGDPLLQEWTEQTFDLSAYALSTVRITFVEQDGLFFFNAHFDDVSVIAATPKETMFDVYLGTTPTLGPAQLLGSTTNRTWDLPTLAPLTTYYWQIVGRRLGVTPGPVWQFSTRGVNHFVWGPIGAAQMVGTPIPVTITALDEQNTVVSNFAGTVQLAAEGVSTLDAIAITPAVASNFVDGVWSGSVTVLDPVALRLRATDEEGHAGVSTPFTVSASNDVSLAITATPNPVLRLRDLQIRLTTTNSGPANATGVRITNQLPSELSFVFAVASQGACSNSGNLLICDLGTIVGGQSASVVINATALTVGTSTNIATVSRIGSDASLANNRAALPITVAPAANLTVNAASADESAGVAVIEVRLDQPSTVPVQFTFATMSAGGALADVDFVSTNGTVTLGPGETNRVFEVQLIDDLLDEASETFVLSVGAVNAIPTSTVYPITIQDDDPPVALSIVDISVAEGDSGTTETRFEARLSGVSGVTAMAAYTFIGGNASSGDFAATNGMLTFPPGVTNRDIVFFVKGDALDETNESFTINLSSGTNVTFVNSQARCTILDDDSPPSVSIADASFLEGQTLTTRSLMVELSAASGLEVSAAFATSNETAIAGSDYNQTSGRVIFPPGTLARTISVGIRGDSTNEGHETFAVLLSNPTNATVAGGFARVTLRNDDTPPGDLDHFVWAAIGATQHVGRPFPVTVTARDFFGNPATNFTGQAPLTVAVNGFSPGISPAMAGPFINAVWNGEITVHDPGSGVRAVVDDGAGHDGVSSPFDIVATNDLSLGLAAVPSPVTTGDSLTFLLSLTNSGPNSATAVVLTNHLPATFQFVSVISSHGVCSNAGTLVICSLGTLGAGSNALVQIQGIAPSAGTLSNHAAVVRGEAETYAGNNSRSISVEVLPTPRVAIASFSMNEPSLSASQAPIAVTLSVPSSRTVTVQFAAEPDSATAADFVPQIGMLTFAPGVVTQHISVTILADSLDESNEHFVITLDSPVNASLDMSSAVGTIVDSDPVPLIAVGDLVVSEANASMAFNINLTAASALPITARFTTQNGTALGGIDYVATNGLLTIPPGTTNQILLVAILPDIVDESDETVALTLSSPTNAAFGDFRGVATITDDDAAPALVLSDMVVAEGNSGVVTGQLRIALSGPSARLISLSYTFLDGSASRDFDFAGTAGLLTFPGNTTNQNIPFTIIGDFHIESDEDFFVLFFSPTNVSVPDPFARVTIANDDGLPGFLDHFTWNAMPNPQRANTPFAATVHARDAFDNPATNFAGTASLRARSGGRPVEIGHGAAAWHYPFSAFFEDARAQVIYHASELGGARRLDGLALNVTALPGQALGSWTVRMKHTTRSNYLSSPLWESAGWTTVLRRVETVSRTGWIEFPFSNAFDYNGTNNLLIDFSFNNTASSFDGESLSTPTAQPRALVFRSDSQAGDPALWSGSSPPPIVISHIPNIRLFPVRAAVPVTPAIIGPFSGAVWSGNITLQAPGTNVQLVADHAIINFGLSDLFDVRAADFPLVLSIARADNAIHLTWQSVAGKSYRIDFKDQLHAPEWQALPGEVLSTGSVAEKMTGFDASAQRFYRVVELP